MQSIEDEFPLPFHIEDGRSVDDIRFEVVCARKRMLECVRCLETLLEVQKRGEHPPDGVKEAALLMIRQANGEMEKEAGFLFLTLLADSRFFPGIDSNLRDKARKVRRALYERVTNVELRLREQVDQLRQDKSMHLREAVFREVVRDVIHERENIPVGNLALRNFDGFLTATVSRQDGTRVPVNPGGVFLVPVNEILLVQVWVSSAQDCEGSAQHEEIKVRDGLDEPLLPVRFEIQGDASHGTLSPATLGAMYKAEEGKSGRVEFRHEGLPAGDHCFWLGCFQGYHYIQGMEMKLRVCQSS